LEQRRKEDKHKVSTLKERYIVLPPPSCLGGLYFPLLDKKDKKTEKSWQRIW